MRRVPMASSKGKEANITMAHPKVANSNSNFTTQWFAEYYMAQLVAETYDQSAFGSRNQSYITEERNRTKSTKYGN